MKNIVYLLGAGASSQSLPTLSDLPRRMEFFLKICKENSIISESTKYENLLKGINLFGTPDTLARKYYLASNQNSDDLYLLKNFISTYFVFEQLGKDETINNWMHNWHISKDDDDDFSLPELQLDQRYLSFLATICNNSTSTISLPTNISIISWNYDVQIERAFQEFTNDSFTVAQNKLNAFPQTRNLSSYSNESFNGFTLLKLNGSAGFFSKTTNDDLFDPKHHSTNGDSRSILSRILNHPRMDYSNMLTFAWENDERVKEARNKARRILSLADVLVIIGYSFPNFNRIIDKDIFSEEQLKTIYVQDPMASQIIQKLEGVQTNMSQRAKPITETTGFYIPYEFWE